MERQTRRKAQGVMQLAVASENLRQVLIDVVQQPEGVQEQVAEVVQRLLDSLRLQQLPTELLHAITTAAGRPSRLLSTTLMNAYGPLTCGLALDLSQHSEPLQALLDRDARRFHGISSLVLSHPGAAEAVHNFIRSVPRVFPSLASLALPWCSISANSVLGLLAPLGSRLAALDIHLPQENAGDDAQPGQPAGHPQVAHDLVNHQQPPLVLQPSTAPLQLRPTSADVLQPFRALRSLILHAPPWHGFHNHSELLTDLRPLAHLSSLQQLQHFELSEPWACHRVPAAPWLPSLARLPLTTLKVTPYMSDWDEASVDTLRGLSLLRCLELSPDFTPSHGAAPDAAGAPQAAVMAAVARLTALTCLALCTDGFGVGVARSAQCLSALSRLSRLSLDVMLHQTDALTDALVALGLGRPQQPTVTRLGVAHVGGGMLSPCLTDQASEGLQRLASCLQDLTIGVIFKSAHSLFSTLAALTSLTRLSVEMPDVEDAEDDPWWDPGTMCDPRLERDWPGAMAPLAALTGLRALAIDEGPECRDRAAKAFLQMASRFTRLQELTLLGDCELAFDDAGGDAVTGVDLWQLLPLQGTLTCLDLGHFSGVDGPGLAVIGQLSSLRTLRLHFLGVPHAELPKYLPLLPDLCDINWE